MTTFTLKRGSTPLLVSLPHVGSLIPPDIASRLTTRALVSEDTDWHLDRLYDFVLALGAGMIHSHYSRYVIDLNRPPDDTRLYSTNTTGLCPLRFFTGEPLYQDGMGPDTEEITTRRKTYWQPYHDAIESELARIKDKFGFAILYDGHSIRSRLPWLFDGKLPDFNLGTEDGKSCSPLLQRGVTDCLSHLSFVVNGRFKGGYITRHYGNPNGNIHTLQMEMCQSTYMQETPPFAYEAMLAANVTPTLHSIIETVLRVSRDAGELCSGTSG